MDKRELYLSLFEQIVLGVVDSLPLEFKNKLRNVAFVVEEWPSQDELDSVLSQEESSLFGLYQGIPQPFRLGYNAALPDKITIFAGPILRTCFSIDQLKQKTRETVLHEIGHHFGMNEAQVRNALMDWD